ncbi:MAG: ribonuclease R [Phenylobacterium sp.]
MARPRPPKRPNGPARIGPRPPQGLPDRATLLAFIRESGEADRSDIARAFGLKGADRIALRDMLRDLQDSGDLGRRGRRSLALPGELPPVGVVEVIERDADGELMVRLMKGDDTPLVRLAPDPNEVTAGAPGLGDRLLVRFERTEAGETEARMIKRLGAAVHRVLGVVRKSARQVRVDPVDRRSRDQVLIEGILPDNLRDGDLVLARLVPGGRQFGLHRGEILERVGREDDPRAASLIAIHAHGIPTGFPEAAEIEAEAAREPVLVGREDLRALPLITIDPPDARDHDDAVFAEPDSDPANPGGWIVWVAIADVAAYVRPGSALDRTAREKGNSVYFPDRVEPMLPERLSAGLCSLRAGENRACIAVRMVFDASGRKTGHRFVRGLMRSAAKLSYEQAQAAIEGSPDDVTGPLLEPVLKPLYAAYDRLLAARRARSPLAIESPERRIVMDPEGRITAIRRRAVLPAHQLIEEMMIQANVSAAQTLEARRTPLIYRVHDTPSQEKVHALADFLATLGLPWSKGEAPRTDRLNRLLEETRESANAAIINEVVLRSQMQAIYDTDNIGHFGLNLDRYAHFTSPIRRYADLIVHRGLIRALGLGEDGLTDRDISQLKGTAEMITAAERRAMAAERDAIDRYVAAFLADRVGATFTGRISGVTRFGLFIRLDETGADGLIPISRLGGEFFIHDETAHALVGERSGAHWPLGLPVEVRLVEATPVTGGLLFDMLSDPVQGAPPPPRPRGAGPSRGPRKPGAADARRRGGPPPGVRKGKRR